MQDSDKNKTMYVDAACVTVAQHYIAFLFLYLLKSSTNLDPHLYAKEIVFLYRYFRGENTIYFSFVHSKARFVVRM